CHDHKFDPISQREFYELFAIFNNADEPALSLPTDEQAKALAELDAKIAAVNKKLAAIDAAAGERQAAWEAGLREEGDVKWQTLAPESIVAKSGAQLQTLDDSSVLIELAKEEERVEHLEDTYEVVIRPGGEMSI